MYCLFLQNYSEKIANTNKIYMQSFHTNGLSLTDINVLLIFFCLVVYKFLEILTTNF